MGTTKANLYDEKTNMLAEFARALAHPARIRILHILLRTDSCINGYLVNELGLAQPTVSQHLKVLKETGVIRGDIESNRLCYCIDTPRWKELQKVLGDFILTPVAEKENCC